MWLLWAIACGPKLPRGDVWATTASAPPAITARPAADGAGPAITLTVLAGSERDPIGREGTAALVADAVLRPLGATWTTGRSAVEARVPCAPGAERACAEAVAAAIVTPPIAEGLPAARAAALATLTAPADDRTLAAEALARVRWRSHPWGHAPAGRASVIPTLDAAELAGFHHRRWNRATVAVVTEGLPDDAVSALRAGLAALPSAPDPLRPHGGDAPFSHPLPSVGTWVVARGPGEAATIVAAWPDTVDPELLADAIATELTDGALVDDALVGPDDGALKATLSTTADRVPAVLAAFPTLPAGATIVVVADDVTAAALREGPSHAIPIAADALRR